MNITKKEISPAALRAQLLEKQKAYARELQLGNRSMLESIAEDISNLNTQLYSLNKQRFKSL
jgi:hypothetical protein